MNECLTALSEKELALNAASATKKDKDRNTLLQFVLELKCQFIEQSLT